MGHFPSLHSGLNVFFYLFILEATLISAQRSLHSGIQSLVGLRRLYGVLRIETESIACKASALLLHYTSGPSAYTFQQINTE